MKWLVDLRDGNVSPEGASGWAGEWLAADNVIGQYVEVDDFGAWDALVKLAGADLSGWPDRTHLHGQADFDAWVRELEVAPISR